MNRQNRNPEKADRHSGMEALRMLAGMAVIVLHFNYLPGGRGAMEGASGLNAVLLTLLETLCICAVNVFVLISGFFGCKAEKVRTGKLAMLLLQTVVFSVAVCLVSGLMDRSLQLRSLAAAALPVNYYVILYLVLMLLSPFLNRLIAILSPKAFTRLILMLFLLFSVYATGVDVLKEVTGAPFAGLSSVGMDGSMNGYSIVHFVMLYLLGAWLRQDAVRAAVRRGAAAAAVPVLMALIFLWNRFLPATAWNYSNPLIVMESAVLLLLFASAKKQRPWVNRIAPASFTCYLMHEAVLSRLDLPAIGAQPTLLLAGVLLIAVPGIYALAFAVMTLWNAAVRPLEKALRARLPEISA